MWNGTAFGRSVIFRLLGFVTGAVGLCNSTREADKPSLLKTRIKIGGLPLFGVGGTLPVFFEDEGISGQFFDE